MGPGPWSHTFDNGTTVTDRNVEKALSQLTGNVWNVYNREAWIEVGNVAGTTMGALIAASTVVETGGASIALPVIGGLLGRSVAGGMYDYLNDDGVHEYVGSNRTPSMTFEGSANNGSSVMYSQGGIHFTYISTKLTDGICTLDADWSKTSLSRYVEGCSTATNHFNAGSANDVLVGAGGADTLWGNTGSDILKGGSGNDNISDGNSADRIWGGAGSDTIWFANDDNRDVVNDFDRKHDHVTGAFHDAVAHIVRLTGAVDANGAAMAVVDGVTSSGDDFLRFDEAATVSLGTDPDSWIHYA